MRGQPQRLDRLTVPRKSRDKGEAGFCGVGDMPVVSSVGPHFGEESVLVGSGGSGTIFFAGCNLGCIFCQNFDISHHRHGNKVTIEQLAQFMLDLQQLHCSNINLVTPTHVAAPAMAAIESARKKGLDAADSLQQRRLRFGRNAQTVGGLDRYLYAGYEILGFGSCCGTFKGT